MTTIIVADDHQIVRQGLVALLKREPGFDIIGEAADGLEASEMVQRLQPDVLVTDLMMDNLNGLDVTRRVCKRSPGTMVVILSMYANEGYVAEALQAGAKAYVLKRSTVDDLVHAIHQVISGHRYLSPSLSELAIDAYVAKTRDTAGLDPYDTLTLREQEVLNMAAQGDTSAAIAKRLYISKRTVEVHRARIMKKLGLKNQPELIRYAAERNLVPIIK